MNLLALETSTECCSVALECNGEIVARSEYAPRRHAELLLPMCEEVLAEAGIVRRQLDAIAVGRGPGAFTGVRLAISAAQGIALALDVPVFPVSSLAALALDVPVDGHALLAVIDARMGEVYAGVFERDIDGLVSLIGTESVGAPQWGEKTPKNETPAPGIGWRFVFFLVGFCIMVFGVNLPSIVGSSLHSHVPVIDEAAHSPSRLHKQDGHNCVSSRGD